MINTSEFKKKTKASLQSSLSYSRKLLDQFDPGVEDQEGRRECILFLHGLEDAIDDMK